jgi:hypothetical protein
VTSTLSRPRSCSSARRPSSPKLSSTESIIPRFIARPAVAHPRFRSLGTYTLPREAWVEGYYEVLHPRAVRLAEHTDATVRAFARDTLREVELVHEDGASYGYVFYCLERVVH